MHNERASRNYIHNHSKLVKAPTRSINIFTASHTSINLLENATPCHLIFTKSNSGIELVASKGSEIRKISKNYPLLRYETDNVREDEYFYRKDIFLLSLKAHKTVDSSNNKVLIKPSIGANEHVNFRRMCILEEFYRAILNSLQCVSELTHSGLNYK